jgi:3-keto-disaccharide hydrolase
MLKEQPLYRNRRSFLKSAAILAAGCLASKTCQGESQWSSMRPLFDGKTLDGWIQIPNSATSVSGNDIVDPAGLAKKLSDKSDPVSAFLSDLLDETGKASLTTIATGTGDMKQERSALAKNLTRIISSGSLYEAKRFQHVVLRPETQQLLSKEPHGAELVHLNRLLLEDAFPEELSKSANNGWVVKDGVMASTGSGRGVIYTANDYSRFRLMFTMRHVSGDPDHQACVLIFCTRPKAGELPLDALAGIQFQVPRGGHWDYRPGQNNNGGAEFTLITKPDYDPHQWSRVEILADASKGKARMAVAQPPENRGIEVLDFGDASAGKTGPIALQMHNAGLFDEYKDLSIDTNPTDELITVK